MALDLKNQITQQIKQSRNLLIALPTQPGADILANALALAAWLEKQKVQFTVVSQDFTQPEKLSFFPGLSKISSKISGLQKTLIEINKDEHPVDDISYTVKNDRLQILLSPKEQPIPASAIKIEELAYAYDLIITLSTVDLSSLGKLYEQNRTFFEKTPIINIDHKPENEQYGQINWVDINATSLTEMLFELILKSSGIDKKLATALLAGIMEATHSFRTTQLTPSALHVVSELLELGAEHETVITNLYRTKTVHLLKLWGHVLTHLQSDRKLSLAWSILPQSVFATTGTSERDLQELMQEILSHTPEAKTVLLFLPDLSNPGDMTIRLHTSSPLHAKDLLKGYNPTGTEKSAEIVLKGKDIQAAESEVLPLIKDRLQKLLSK